MGVVADVGRLAGTTWHHRSVDGGRRFRAQGTRPCVMSLSGSVDGLTRQVDCPPQVDSRPSVTQIFDPGLLGQHG
jgi:hypothetical protein